MEMCTFRCMQTGHRMLMQIVNWVICMETCKIVFDLNEMQPHLAMINTHKNKECERDERRAERERERSKRNALLTLLPFDRS